MALIIGQSIIGARLLITVTARVDSEWSGLMVQVIDMMNAEIASIRDSIERFRPHDAAKRSSLSEELQHLRNQLMESRLFSNL